VLGIVHAIEGSKAKLTYFRLDADALTELRQSAVKGARIEISLVDDAGTAVTSESCALSYCPRRGAGMFLCDGTKAFAPGKPEPVLVLVPGGCEFGTVQNSFDASTASLKPVKVGGSQGFDTEWFGLLHFDFAEADIERAREHGELDGAFKSVGEALEATTTKIGLERFGTAGEDFDPMVHEALTSEAVDGIETPTVMSVYQPGYRFAGRVLRPARVAVAGTD
jgi:hypothetical protein